VDVKALVFRHNLAREAASVSADVSTRGLSSFPSNSRPAAGTSISIPAPATPSSARCAAWANGGSPCSPAAGAPGQGAYLDGIDGPRAPSLRKEGVAEMLDNLTGYLAAQARR
jgi:hypothetical protein